MMLCTICCVLKLVNSKEIPEETIEDIGHH